MKRLILFSVIFNLFFLTSLIYADNNGGAEMDELKFGNNTIKIHFFGHGSLMIELNDKKVYIDPVSQYAEYEKLPKADIVLITHEHGDHLDIRAIKAIEKDNTEIISNKSSNNKIKKGKTLQNYELTTVGDINIEAVPAYNTSAGRDRFHPKGRDNGYIISLGDTKVYIAGDTEDIPEMKTFNNITIAFLPVNQPYTMTVDQLLSAAKMIQPEILYPYHFSDTDTKEMERVIKENTDIDIRIRGME